MAKTLQRLCLLCVASVAPLMVAWADEPSIQWQDDLRKALATAKEEGRLVLLAYMADDCAFCVRMDRDTLSKPSVVAAVQKFVPVRATPKSPRIRYLRQKYDLKYTPSHVVLNPSGQVVVAYNGYRPEAVFLMDLKNATMKAEGKAQKPTTRYRGGT